MLHELEHSARVAIDERHTRVSVDVVLRVNGVTRCTRTEYEFWPLRLLPMASTFGL